MPTSPALPTRPLGYQRSSSCASPRSMPRLAQGWASAAQSMGGFDGAIGYGREVQWVGDEPFKQFRKALARDAFCHSVGRYVP